MSARLLANRLFGDLPLYLSLHKAPVVPEGESCLASLPISWREWCTNGGCGADEMWRFMETGDDGPDQSTYTIVGKKKEWMEILDKKKTANGASTSNRSGGTSIEKRRIVENYRYTNGSGRLREFFHSAPGYLAATMVESNELPPWCIYVARSYDFDKRKTCMFCEGSSAGSFSLPPNERRGDEAESTASSDDLTACMDEEEERGGAVEEWSANAAGAEVDGEKETGVEGTDDQAACVICNVKQLSLESHWGVLCCPDCRCALTISNSKFQLLNALSSTVTQTWPSSGFFVLLTGQSHLYKCERGGACVTDHIWIEKIDLNNPEQDCDIFCWACCYSKCLEAGMDPNMTRKYFVERGAEKLVHRVSLVCHSR